MARIVQLEFDLRWHDVHSCGTSRPPATSENPRPRSAPDWTERHVMGMNILLGDAVEDYLGYRRARCAEATVKNEAFLLRRFVSWYGNVQLRHMTAEKVAAWFDGPDGLRNPHVTRDGVRRNPIEATTANYHRTRLASFFRWANRAGHLRRDLLEGVEAYPTIERARLQPPPETLLRLVDLVAEGRDRAFIALIINTGFRAGTATSIRVGDVDLDEFRISVAIKKTRQEDAFPITADLAAELDRWLRRYALDLGRPLGRDDFLFPSRKASVFSRQIATEGPPVRLRTAPRWVPSKQMTHPERVVQGALRGAGLPTRGEGVHTVRRAVARAFFDSMATTTGYDAALRTVSAMLHHKSSATTEHYLGLSSERARRDEILRGRAFLTAMVPHPADVRVLRPAEG